MYTTQRLNHANYALSYTALYVRPSTNAESANKATSGTTSHTPPIPHVSAAVQDAQHAALITA